MTIPVVTFFSNTGSSGKSSLVYHISHLLAELGKKVLVLDLDPQSNLTKAFLGDDVLEELWSVKQESSTVFQAANLLIQLSYPFPAKPVFINQNLSLIPGDIGLGRLEDELSAAWWGSSERPHRSRVFRALTAFSQIAQKTAIAANADLILIDLGSNLGAINRSALIGTDYVISPLGIDLLSLQGLNVLGSTLHAWRSGWSERVEIWENPYPDFPYGEMRPLGYVLQRNPVNITRPLRADSRWVNQFPGAYHQYVLGEAESSFEPNDDPYCLGILKNYHSLISMAKDAGKPIYKLTPSDGAIGNHAVAVGDAYVSFAGLSIKILEQLSKRNAKPAI